MEAVKILEKPTAITWDYDEEADVLYLSTGEPQPAVGRVSARGSFFATTRSTKKSWDLP